MPVQITKANFTEDRLKELNRRPSPLLAREIKHMLLQNQSGDIASLAWICQNVNSPGVWDQLSKLFSKVQCNKTKCSLIKKMAESERIGNRSFRSARANLRLSMIEETCLKTALFMHKEISKNFFVLLLRRIIKILSRLFNPRLARQIAEAIERLANHGLEQRSWSNIPHHIKTNDEFIYKLASLQGRWVDKVMEDASFLSKIPKSIRNDQRFSSQVLARIQSAGIRGPRGIERVKLYLALNLQFQSTHNFFLNNHLATRDFADYFIEKLELEPSIWLTVMRKMNLTTNKEFVIYLTNALQHKLQSSKTKEEHDRFARYLKLLDDSLVSPLNDDSDIKKIFKSEQLVPVIGALSKSSKQDNSIELEERYFRLIRKDPSAISVIPELHRGNPKLLREASIRKGLNDRFDSYVQFSQISPSLLLQSTFIDKFCNNSSYAGYPLLIIYKSVLSGPYDKSSFPPLTANMHNPWDYLSVYDESSRGPLLDLIEIKAELFLSIHEKFRNDRLFQREALARNKNLYHHLSDQDLNYFLTNQDERIEDIARINRHNKIRHILKSSKLISYLAALSRCQDSKANRLINSVLSSDELARLVILATKGSGSQVLRGNPDLQLAYYGDHYAMEFDMDLAKAMKAHAHSFRFHSIRNYLNVITQDTDHNLSSQQQQYRKSFYRSGLPKLFHCTQNLSSFSAIIKSGHLKVRQPGGSQGNLAKSRHSGGLPGAFVSTNIESYSYGQFGFAFSDKHLALGGQFCMFKTSSRWFGLGCDIPIKHAAFAFVDNSHYSTLASNPLIRVEGVDIPVLSLSQANSLHSLMREVDNREQRFAQSLCGTTAGSTVCFSIFDKKRAESLNFAEAESIKPS